MKKLILLLFISQNLSYSQDSLRGKYSFKSDLLLKKSNFFEMEKKFNFKIKNLELEKPVDYKIYFDRICYPKLAKDQKQVVVLDYIFNKYVIKRIFFNKE